MPFGIGFFATAGAGGGAAPAMELISTQLITSATSSVTFSSIPATYKHLQVRATIRTDRSGNTDDLMTMRVNGDTGGNYANHLLFGNGSSVSSAANATGLTYQRNFRVAGNDFTSSGYAAMVYDILDYSNTSKNTTSRHLIGLAGNYNEIGLGSGLWMNTAAVTSLTFFMAITATNFVGGTRFSLYGVKG